MARGLKFVVVVLRFYVPPTAKVIRRRDLGFKSHPKDCLKFDCDSTIYVANTKAGYCTANLCICFCIKYAKIRFSHDEAHIKQDLHVHKNS